MQHIFAALAALASTAYAFSTPWPLPQNLTVLGGSSSIATVSPSFAFSCDAACDAACSTHPIVQGAFLRYEARMRPPPGARLPQPPPPPPMPPSRTTAGFWWRYPGADCDGVQYDLGRSCDGADVAACEATCAAAPGCAGFNTRGVLKNASCGPGASILPGAGCNGCVDLYLLRTAPEPPPGVLVGVTVCLLSGSDRLGPGTDESYALSAPNDGAGSLRAATMFGALRGLETLAQLLDIYGVPSTARQIALAPILVADAPRFEYRGLLIDSARHFLPVATIERAVDALSYSKLNVLHWHIVDSNSFPCGSAIYPELAAKGAYDATAVYSVADLARVVAYAKARGVRVLPEWDVPGHGGWGAGVR